MFLDLVEIFQEYTGNGLILLWFFLCVIYLFLTEKKKGNRILFVYLPLVVSFLFFNPLFARIALLFLDDAIYYRFLWLLPVTAVIAYTATELYGRLAGKQKILFAAAMAVLIAISGRNVYKNSNFHPAENLYHVPQDVADICDAIQYPGREVMAVFPVELISFVRQYSGVVCMPYGREVLVNNVLWDPLYYLMESETAVSAEELAQAAKRNRCVYIVVNKTKKITGSLAACDFESFFMTDRYAVYRDITVDLSY